jgi:hypothetical protein
LKSEASWALETSSPRLEPSFRHGNNYDKGNRTLCVRVVRSCRFRMRASSERTNALLNVRLSGAA